MPHILIYTTRIYQRILLNEKSDNAHDRLVINSNQIACNDWYRSQASLIKPCHMSHVISLIFKYNSSDKVLQQWSDPQKIRCGLQKLKQGLQKKTTNQHLSDFQVQNLNILQVLLGKYQHPKNKSDFLMGLQNCFKLFRRVPS